MLQSNLKYIFERRRNKRGFNKVYVSWNCVMQQNIWTNRDERCCRANYLGRRNCRNRCVGLLGCCSGGNGPRSRKIWSNSEKSKKSSALNYGTKTTLMKTVWSSEPVIRGLSLPRTNLSSSTGHLPFKVNFSKYSFLFGQIYFFIWTFGQRAQPTSHPSQVTSHSKPTFCKNTLFDFNNYILQLGQISFAIWTDTFCNQDKYILLLGQIYLAICTNQSSSTGHLPLPIQLFALSAMPFLMDISSWPDMVWFKKRYFSSCPVQNRSIGDSGLHELTYKERPKRLVTWPEWWENMTWPTFWEFLSMLTIFDNFENFWQIWQFWWFLKILRILRIVDNFWIFTT